LRPGTTNSTSCFPPSSGWPVFVSFYVVLTHPSSFFSQSFITNETFTALGKVYKYYNIYS